MPQASILIPTYNRCEKLRVVLDALQQQEGLEDVEVVVGIDGSTDGTAALLEELVKSFPVPLRFFRIPNSGRAVIRNRLIDEAHGDLLIFIQDDIVVRKGWLRSHLDAHQRFEGAVIGHVTWYPKQEVTPYMHWLEHGGHMLDFSSLSDGQETDFWHFYMGNLSVSRSLLGALRFDESFAGYGWEDIVLGLAFVKQGGKVYYMASARAYHWDEYREEDLTPYMQKVGKSAVLAEQQYPGTGFVPPFWKRLVFWLLIRVSRPFMSLLPQTWRWYVEMKKAFLEAVDKELDP